mmetsp:Transcript_81432/g.213790  ORF Transcript_81432/g.213790 Transcript_81432/m.213790 type:complete len:238 (-) Transcript_81432:881-1594(-)
MPHMVLRVPVLRARLPHGGHLPSPYDSDDLHVPHHGRAQRRLGPRYWPGRRTEHLRRLGRHDGRHDRRVLRALERLVDRLPAGHPLRARERDQGHDEDEGGGPSQDPDKRPVRRHRQRRLPYHCEQHLGGVSGGRLPEQPHRRHDPSDVELGLRLGERRDHQGHVCRSSRSSRPQRRPRLGREVRGPHRGRPRRRRTHERHGRDGDCRQAFVLRAAAGLPDVAVRTEVGLLQCHRCH